MTEPTSTTAAAGYAFGAVFVALVGVEPQALVWGVVGAVIGLTFAPPTGRFRAGLVFLAVAFASAALGTWAAEYWHSGSHVARNAWSLGVAVLFHPLFAALVQAVPAAVQAFVSRKAGGQ